MMEGGSLIRAAISLAFVLGLVLLMGWVMRRVDMQKLTRKMQAGRRLQLREQLPLDARRKAMIIACDEQEYLVLLGAQGESMIPLTKDKGEIQ